MKLCRMKTQYAGPSGTCDAGGKIKLCDEEAEVLRLAGFADVLDVPAAAAPAPEPEVEVAAEEAPETATETRPRRRTR